MEVQIDEEGEGLRRCATLGAAVKLCFIECESSVPTVLMYKSEEVLHIPRPLPNIILQVLVLGSVVRQAS